MKFAVFATLLAAGSVSAHGVMSKFIANGKSYGGPSAGATDRGSPIRPISSVEPVVDVNSDAYGCGPGSSSAGKTAEVKAGTDMEFQMRNGGGGNWIHIMGPTFYSIYKCPGDAGSCKPGRNAGWATIRRAGADGAGWVMGKFGRGENVKVRIPAGTPNGNYLVRQELLALHNGHESYIQCVQIKVTGGSNGSLEDKGAKLMAYPGTLKGTEAGFKFNPYGASANTYPWPGTPVFKPNGGNGGNAPGKPPKGKPAPKPPKSDPKPKPKPKPSPPKNNGGGGKCAPGAIRCDSPKSWSQCANGGWVSMGPVAAGTSCKGGKLTRRASRLFRFDEDEQDEE